MPLCYTGGEYIFFERDSLMPIYEYECNQCGEAFEKMMRFSEADQIPACPHCQGIFDRTDGDTLQTCGTLIRADATRPVDLN